MAQTTVNDIIIAMENIAPSRFAENWDNVGLQVGQKDWSVQTVLIALDPLLEVVAAACANDVDLLITHHPLIFNHIKSIDTSTPVGRVIDMALRHRVAIFSAHTNLDSAADGLNDSLARKIGLTNIKVLDKTKYSQHYKLVVYVPVEYEKIILNSLFDSDIKTRIGVIGKYTCCSFRNIGKGTFKPGPFAKPFTGKPNRLSDEDEVRIETVVQKENLRIIIDEIKKIHPYETMAYDVYPLSESATGQNTTHGLGRIGDIEKKTDLFSFASEVKNRLGLSSLKIAGKAELPVKKAAVCTGSGSGLFKTFLRSEADVYISGDLKYHDARTAEAANLGLIDIGHFASEHLIVKELAYRLRKILSAAGIDIKIEKCRLEKDPFLTL